MAGRGLFVGIGVDVHPDPDQTLEHAVAEIHAWHDLLGSDFDGEPLDNPDEKEVRDYLDGLPELTAGGPMVVVWCGHAVSSRFDGLRLLTRGSGTNAMAGIPIAEIVGRCAEKRADQLFVVLDTCFSGAGVEKAIDVAAAVQQLEPPAGERVFFGILASCLPLETAVDGRFSRWVLDVIRNGPSTPARRLPWARYNAFLSAEDVGNAVQWDWPKDGSQRPVFRPDGEAVGIIPNRLFEPAAPAVVVEHLLRAARSSDEIEQRSWFTGRAGEMSAVVDWAVSGVPGLRILTGSAGTGKSAILGRLVSSSTASERDRLLEQGPLGHADPGVRSVAAHAHARGLTADQLAGILDDQLTRVAEGRPVALLPPDDSGQRNAALLVGALQRLTETGAPPPVIVVDGLDEARGEAFSVARDLLARLSAHAVVIVSARDLVEPGSEPQQTLINALAPVGVMDLDADQWQESGVSAMRSYVEARLGGVDERMAPGAIADRLTPAMADTRDQPFLLARLVCDQLRVDPIDTTVRGWDEGIADSVGRALDIEIDAVAPPSHRTLPDGMTAPALARAMVTALTWGLGAGFPEDEWRVVTAALAAGADLTDISRYDVSWALEQLGRFIVQDGQGGVAVYRMAHQSLADQLRPPFVPSSSALFDPAADPVTESLLTRYEDLLSAGIHPAAPRYLWLYTQTHAAQAGPSGAARLRALVDRAPELRGDLATCDLAVAGQLGEWGLLTEALNPTQEAVDLYRRVAADNVTYRPVLAGALNNLGNRLAAVGRLLEALEPAQEAVDLYRGLATDNVAYLPDLAMALTNFSTGLADLGRRVEALHPAQEAVDLYRGVAADYAGYGPDLAGALNNLGNRLAELGRRAEALDPTQEAVDLYRRLGAENPGYLPDLAGALTNIGVRLAVLGRWADALDATQEAVLLYRRLGAENPGYRPDLAGALNNLGNRLGELGRRSEALEPSKEAVDLYRGVSASNPGYRPELASSLANLGNRLAALGRRVEALDPVREAVDLYRGLSVVNPGYLPDFAMALTNFSIGLAEVGQRAEALDPTEESVGLYRELVLDNSGYLPDLASALSNLGIRLAALGRRVEALDPAREAVELRRGLVADNPGYLPDLASALNNLGNRLAALGQRAEALDPTQEAVDLYRGLVADNPGYLPDLASALTNLGIRLAALGRLVEALDPAQEAVDLRRGLSAVNPGYLADLASALINLGNRLAALGQRGEALDLTQEAVDIYRGLVADNPGYLPDLASASNNFGVRLAEVGRRAEALDLAKEAVDLYRGLAADNPVYLSDLARVLTNLERHGEGPIEVAASETFWRKALDGLSDSGAATLLLYRAQLRQPDDPRAPAWLAEGLRRAHGDRGLESAIRDEARRRRQVDPDSFDACWTTSTGSELPDWARLDPALLDAVRAWTSTPTYTDERDYLAAHTELLEETADGAVEEVLAALAGEDADRYQQLRHAARVDGVEDAYRPLLLSILAGDFIRADPAEQQRMLADRRDDLLHKVLTSTVRRVATEEDPIEAQRAIALLSLAARGPGAPLDAVFDALNEPALVPDLLHSCAAAGEPDNLADIAVCAYTRAGTEAQAALAVFYLAIAAAQADDLARATSLLAEARQLDLGAKGNWLELLADLSQPELRPLVQALRSSPMPVRDTPPELPPGEGA